MLSGVPRGCVQCDAGVTSLAARGTRGDAAGGAAVRGTLCPVRMGAGRGALDKWLPCNSGHEPPADTNARFGCLGVSLQPGVPVTTWLLRQLCQQAGLHRAGTGYCGSGGSFGLGLPPVPPCLPQHCLAVGTRRARGRERACSCCSQAAVEWEDSVQRAGGDGGPPKGPARLALCPIPPPHPVYSVQHLREPSEEPVRG